MLISVWIKYISMKIRSNIDDFKSQKTESIELKRVRINKIQLVYLSMSSKPDPFFPIRNQITILLMFFCSENEIEDTR